MNTLFYIYSFSYLADEVFCNDYLILDSPNMFSLEVMGGD